MLSKHCKNVVLLFGIVLAGIAFGYGAPRFHEAFQVHHRKGDYAAYFRAHPDVDAIVYGTRGCSFCEKAQRYFEAKKINYRFVDVQQSREAAEQHARLGGGGVPTILIGDRLIQGFWVREIDEALLNTKISVR